MLHELYGIFGDIDNALVITFILLGLTGLAWASFVWTNAKAMNRRMTTGQWVHVYAGAGLGLFCGICFLAFFIVPANAESLLELLHIRAPLLWLAAQVQQFIQWLLRALM